MFKGFKDFLMRGNIIDLAVAVVVGTAFTAVVTAFTSSIIKPIIALAGGAEVKGFGFQLDASKPATFIDLSSAINAVITFLITAAVVYFLFVLPMQKVQERRKKGKEEEQEASEAELLAEIRNLLRREQGLTAVSGTQPAPSEDSTSDTARVAAMTTANSTSSQASTN